LSGSITLDPSDSGGIDLDQEQVDMKSCLETAPSLSSAPIKFASVDEKNLYVEAIELCRKGLSRADRILILIQEGKSLSIKESFGSKAAFVIMREEVSSAIVRRARRKNRAVYINDALADEELSPRQSIRRIGQRSVLCTPINSEGKNIGILYADSISEVGAFDEDNLRWSIRLATALGRKLSEVRKSRPSPSSQANTFLPSFKKEKVPQDEPSALRSFPLPSTSEKVIFLRSLACMLSSGFPIFGALDLLSNGRDRMAPFASQIAQDVSKGWTLSSACARHPQLFGKDLVNLLSVGENSGTLDNVTVALADAQENQMLMKNKVVSALTYPAVIFGFCALCCFLAPPLFLNDFFANIAETSSSSLPWLTRLVMWCSAALWNPGVWVAVLSLGVLLKQAFKRSGRSASATQFLESRLLDVPVFGEMYRNISVLKFARALGMQLEAGMYLDKSVLLAAEASGSPLLSSEAQGVVKRIKSGESFSFALERSEFFPRTLIEFIRVGEETAKLGEMCAFVERLLTTKTENSIEVMQALIEPLAMAVVGILVGIVAIACLLPLVQMVQAFV
jgi:type IV pilus assembly protein PilC